VFVSSKKIRFAVTATAVTAALFMNSCGGKKVSATQAAAQGGFETVTTPASELEDIQRQLDAKNMPSGIGIGRSTDEQVARNESADQARSQVAQSIGVHVQRLSESYAQNVGGEAKKIWEEGVRQITDQHLSGARVFKTIVQFNKEAGQYQVYSLIILDPELFKKAIAQSMARDEEFELRVKKDDMMSKLDANIAEYNDKYKR
jgi:hypothetical protein